MMRNFGIVTLGLFVSLNLHAASNQGFETDISGISSIHALLEPTTPNLVRVASGGVNIPTSTSSQGGAFFSEVAMFFEDDGDTFSVQGDRISWNNGPYSGDYVSGNGFSVDVFFDDPSFYDPIGPTVDGFFFQPTLLNDGNADAVNGGGFGARLFDPVGDGVDTDFVWRVGADGDAKGYSGVSTFYEIDVASSGWYTMSTFWETNTDSGNINQVNTLTSIASSSVVYTATIEDAVAAGQAGALGAASLGNGDLGGGPASTFGDLAIDNVTVVPEPSAFALILGVVGLSFAAIRRRR
jgi:hypothetical protein